MQVAFDMTAFSKPKRDLWGADGSDEKGRWHLETCKFIHGLGVIGHSIIYNCDEDDATIVEGDERAARRLHLAALVLGTATRLLLGGLGTTSMARVIAERSTIKRDSSIAVEVLGWLLV
jgi:hypothetical protein